MNLSTREIKGIVVFDMFGKLDICIKDDLMARLEFFFAAKKERFIMDVTSLQDVNSSGLGVLVSMVKRIHANHARMRLCGVNTDVMQLLVVSHLIQLFEICDTLDSALENFN